MAEDKESNAPDEEAAAATAEETPAGEAETEQPAEAPGRPGRAGVWLGLAALLAALGAAAAGGYAYWRLEQRLAGMDEDLAAAREQGEAARQAAGAVRDRLAAVREEQKALAGRADKLAGETQALRQATEDLFARIEGGPTYWRLERVESLLLAADRVVRLERDTQAGYAALAEADRMLRALKDPAWLDAREAIQAAMTRLEQSPDPDLPGIAFRLSSLADAALDLPLKRQEAPAMDSQKQAAAAPPQPESMWGKVKAALGQFWADIRGLVRLRRSGEDVEPLLPPDKAVFLRHNLVLNLQAARLAALRGHAEVYRQSLTSARDWVARFFDGDQDEVAAMLGALDELAGHRVAPDLPQLDKPLRVFRQVREERQG
jgi:uroporphyrin-3 C-methyltransferase